MADLTPEQLDEIERRAKAAYANDTEWVGELVAYEGGGWMASPRIHRYENEDGNRADEAEESAAEADQEYVYAADPATVISLISELRRLRVGIPEGVLQVERATLTAALVYITAEINQYRSKSNAPPRIRRAQELLEYVLNPPPGAPDNG